MEGCGGIKEGDLAGAERGCFPDLGLADGVDEGLELMDVGLNFCKVGGEGGGVDHFVEGR